MKNKEEIRSLLKQMDTDTTVMELQVNMVDKKQYLKFMKNNKLNIAELRRLLFEENVKNENS